MFAGLNLLTGNETFLTISQTMLEPWATFLIGAAILLLSQVVLSYGMRFYLTLNKWVFILAMASTVFLIVVLAMSTREQFVANLNELVGPSLGVPDAYNAIIASGKEKGWGEAGFDLWQTILVSNWPFLPLIGAAFSIAIGGEIKSVGKSQTVGMLGAVFVATVAWLITVWLAYKVFGFEFLGTAVFNTLTANGGLTTPTDPVDRAAHRHSHQIAADHRAHVARACAVDVDVDSGDAYVWRPGRRRLGVRPSGAGAARNHLGEISHADRRHHGDDHREPDLHGAVRLHAMVLEDRDPDRGGGACLVGSARRGHVLPLSPPAAL